MAIPGRTPPERFRAEVRRLKRAARARLAARRLVAGLFVGCVAGAAWALARPLLPLAAPSMPTVAVTGLLAAVGALVGAVIGGAARIETRRLLIAVDRALGTHELAGTALDLLAGSRSSAFADLIIEEAVGALALARARAVFGRPRIRLLPFLPLAAAAALAASLLPFSLRDLFPRPSPSTRTIAFLGEELDEAGRKLEEAARGRDLRRDLELALRLEQLGQDLREERVPAEELERRLAQLERELAEHYARRLELWRQREGLVGGASDGSTAERDASADESSDVEGGPTAEQAEGAGEEEAGTSGAAELAEALDLLREMQDQLAAGGRGASGEDGGRGEGLAQGGRDGGRSGAGEEARSDGSSLPGTSPQKDVPAAGEPLSAPEGGEALQAAAEVGEGDLARLLVRALPEPGTARLAEEQVLGDYRRQAESALAGEQVPFDLRGYVRSYFLRLGVIGKE